MLLPGGAGADEEAAAAVAAAPFFAPRSLRNLTCRSAGPRAAAACCHLCSTSLAACSPSCSRQTVSKTVPPCQRARQPANQPAGSRGRKSKRKSVEAGGAVQYGTHEVDAFESFAYEGAREEGGGTIISMIRWPLWSRKSCPRIPADSSGWVFFEGHG